MVQAKQKYEMNQKKSMKNYMHENPKCITLNMTTTRVKFKAKQQTYAPTYMQMPNASVLWYKPNINIK